MTTPHSEPEPPHSEPEPALVSMPRRARQEIIPANAEFPLIETPEAREEMLELAEENLARNFNMQNLPRIRATKDGYFQIESAEEAPKLERTILGIIPAYRVSRIYWGRSYNPGASKEPPSCVSADGFRGEGDPGGPCARCPFAQFKSARNPDGSQAQGQACKELRDLLVLLPGQMMPHHLAVQPTSLQAFDKYSLNLNYSGGGAYWNVVTKFALEIVPASGYPVARIVFSIFKRTAPEQRQALKPYHLKMRELLAPMVVDASAYEMPDSGNPNAVPF